MSRGRPHVCPFCGSKNTSSKGVRHCKTLGLRRVRRCKDCGRKFTPKHQAFVPIEEAKASIQ